MGGCDDAVEDIGMSVAFRRDSDEEHREPRFELPLPPGPNLVTKRGLAQIEARNAELDAQIAAAPTLERRAELLRDARYWRTRLTTAQLAPVPTGDTVAIGTTVTIEQNGRERVLTIVGHDEGDARTGHVAFGAPLARALMGAEVDDEVEVPGQARAVTIVAIVVTSAGV